ncbi:MAG TPA: FtsX-like permease family protein [Armatimonadota bacterium]|nr:FtsX-like permease family protein [Armatimonadota bacterium]
MTTAANVAGIQRQIKLPLTKAFEISFKSIKNRFWRTMITAIGILLGIAFLVSVISSSYFARAAAFSYGPLSPQWIAYKKQLDLGQIQTREAWLVALALLVSTIGILNSMLMSVAERYREIGTMKCLGALDAFIIKLFIIEALMTGIIASVLGGLLGFILIFLSYLGQQGTAWLHFANFGDLFKWIGISIISGSFLALIASAWPAALAAKMPPVDAFRVEV